MNSKLAKNPSTIASKNDLIKNLVQKNVRDYRELCAGSCIATGGNTF